MQRLIEHAAEVEVKGRNTRVAPGMSAASSAIVGAVRARPTLLPDRDGIVSPLRLFEARHALMECFRAGEGTCVLVPRFGPPDMPPAILAAAR